MMIINDIQILYDSYIHMLREAERNKDPRRIVPLFTSDKTVSRYYPPMEWAVECEILKGRTDENGNIILMPKAYATSAEIEAFIHRYILKAKI